MKKTQKYKSKFKENVYVDNFLQEKTLNSKREEVIKLKMKI